ncbi:hypothetical protein COY51_07150 [Candidatus Desantisbacteria bacterium CG_4_10_14_0_8_um_filter_39_17]|uniref:Uncharacterized protein n=1 Tax=Candidatus Desantisbacteria bacterium CG_4_10_14_0_8_um_filter_39_17 TaxID=1974542 RepID=A0A2H9P9B7_9BACT|nr:MAG: hypothetical protein COY51_07150 [Candidatus Desantisbacteria bacterium CG_4_10_14_0_8_um_filter_39_17]
MLTTTLDQILSSVKKLGPEEKILLWQKLETDITSVTARIRNQARNLKLDKLSLVQIDNFIQELRKNRVQSNN